MQRTYETGDVIVKLAISGKGGVGKTTLAAGLARLFAVEGRRVIAIDADPDANLAAALGADEATAAACVPLSHMDDLIEERTGARPGQGGMFRLNPDVADVVEICGVDIDGVTFLRMGTVERGGSGCMCAEGTFLKAFMHHLIVEREDIAILDMEAGIEHLGRGTAESVDVFVVVVEPGSRSVQTAHLVRGLAADIGVRDVVAIGNRVRDERDVTYLLKVLGDVPLLGILPEAEGVREADREGSSPFGADEGFTEALRVVGAALVNRAQTT
jgi:CO dehydrogenase maturation factor